MIEYYGLKYIEKRYDVSYYSKLLNEVSFLKSILLSQIQQVILDKAGKIPLYSEDGLISSFKNNIENNYLELRELVSYYNNKKVDELNKIDKALFALLPQAIQKIIAIKK